MRAAPAIHVFLRVSMRVAPSIPLFLFGLVARAQTPATAPASSAPHAVPTTASAAPAAEDARVLLQQAGAALNAVQSVGYEAVAEIEGPLRTQVPAATAKVLLQRRPGEAWPNFRIEGRYTPPNASEALSLTVVGDGWVLALADHTNKIYRQMQLSERMRGLSILLPVLVSELVEEQPYAEPPGATLEYAGRAEVGDVECNVVGIVQPGGETRWFLGAADHLPRRVQRVFKTANGRATLTTTLADVALNPSVEEASFKLERPAEYDASEQERILLRPGTAAPDWRLKSGDGSEVSLASLRGKVVLLDFWATWCRPCIMSMPHVQKLHEKYRDRPVAVLAVNCFQERDPRADPVAFVKERGCTYPVLLKGDEVARAYRIEGIPAMVLIGPDGRVLSARAGLTREGDRRLEQEIERALSATSQPATTRAAD